VGSMFFYYAGAGLTYPVAVAQSITLTPFATVGFSGGKLDYQSGYTFLLPALDVGASAEWALSERLRLAAALSYRHVFDPTLPGSFIQLHLGAGYIF
ncbi:MAG TPA: hypothetical protein PLY93_12475, partial [Turneriella sp.]|nr:hypothetical protein [Turneriella sp.]